MRIALASFILALSLAAGTAVAAAAPDRCAEQEQALRTQTVAACSGLSYLFNPSGCFIAEKAQKAFDVDTCRAAAASEQTLPEPQAVPEPRTMPEPRTLPEPRTAASDVPAPRCDIPEKSPHGAAVTGQDAADLKAENDRLKAEIERLRAELELLRGNNK